MPTNQDFICSAYLKRGCPFSFKFLIAVTELGLLDQIKIIEMIPGADDYDTVKDGLSEKLGKPATFPTVEVEVGKFMSDSDELIEYFAAKQGVEVANLQVLPFYLKGIMANLRKFRQANMAYKDKYGELG